MNPSFTTFVINHWELWLAFVVILAALIITELQAHFKVVHSISAHDAVELINHQHANLVDIRDKSSFNQGHIIDALCFPENEIKDKHAELKKFKEKPMIIVCAKGHSAINIVAYLKTHGFDRAVYLKGGISAWQHAGYPIHKE